MMYLSTVYYENTCVLGDNDLGILSTLAARQQTRGLIPLCSVAKSSNVHPELETRDNHLAGVELQYSTGPLLQSISPLLADPRRILPARTLPRLIDLFLSGLANCL